MTTRWNARQLTAAEDLAQRIPAHLLDLGPYLYEDPEMSGLQRYMSEMTTWIDLEIGHVDNALMLDVMAKIGVTIGRWYQHVLSQPCPERFGPAGPR